VARMEEVLLHALVRQPRPILWKEEVKAVVTPPPGDDDSASLIAH